MHDQVLRKLVQDVEGGLAGFVLGPGGVAQAVVVKEEPWPSGAAGPEMAFVLDQVRRAASILRVGELEEVLVRCEASLLLLRRLGETGVLGLVLGPQSDISLGRFMLRLGATEMTQASSRP